MKKLLIAIATLSLVSCSGFLSERKTTSLSEDSVYGTKQSLESSISGCYSQMSSGQGWKGGMIEYLQEASGLVHWSGQRTEEHWLQCLDFTLYSNNTWNQQFFTALYSYISKANLLISNLSKSPVEQSFKNEIEAEARFIRAVTYFSLVRMYGDLPLHTEPVTTEASSNIPRTPYTQVYKQILDDLTYAETYMRTPERQMENTGGFTGRPNKWAASAYKSLVYLHIACILETPQDQNFYNPSVAKHLPDFSSSGITSKEQAYSLCLAKAEAVINSNAYQLADDYAKLFRWGWKQEADGSWTRTPEDYLLSERIFVLQSTNNATTNTNYSVQRTVPAYPEGTLNYKAENAQAGRVRPERYVVQKWTKTYGGHLDSGRSDKMNGVWVDCLDPRFDATYVYGGYNYNHANYKEWIPVYPADGCVSTASNITLTYDDGSTYSVSNTVSAIWKKYIDHEYDASKGNADFYMMRFAEVYLIAAEAAASLSSSPGDQMWTKALDYVEVLHRRARGELSADAPKSTQPTWKDGNHNFSTREELVKAIMWERVYELGGEGHEFFDTHRRGTEYIRTEIAEPINAFLMEAEQSSSEKYGYFGRCFNKMTYPTESAKIRKGLLCSFPENELNYNQALGLSDQNDYFVK